MDRAPRSGTTVAAPSQSGCRRSSRARRRARTWRPRSTVDDPGHGSVSASMSADPRTPHGVQRRELADDARRPGARRCRGPCRRARRPPAATNAARLVRAVASAVRVAADGCRASRSSAGPRVAAWPMSSASRASVNGVWASTSTPASSASRVIPPPSTCATTESPRSCALATIAASVWRIEDRARLCVERDLDDGCPERRLLVHCRRCSAADPGMPRRIGHLAHDRIGGPGSAPRVSAARRQERAGICHSRHPIRFASRELDRVAAEVDDAGDPAGGEKVLVDEVQVHVMVDERRQRDAVLTRDRASTRPGGVAEQRLHLETIGMGHALHRLDRPTLTARSALRTAPGRT